MRPARALLPTWWQAQLVLETLPQPQNVRAILLTDGSVQVSWTGAPTNAQAVIEVNPEGLIGFESLGSSPAAGPYTYTPVSPGNNRYRVKFVRGDSRVALRRNAAAAGDAWIRPGHPENALPAVGRQVKRLRFQEKKQEAQLPGKVEAKP